MRSADNINRKPHIAMIGQKSVPSRDGGIEVVVWELAKRLYEDGYEVDCYNRMGYEDSSVRYEKVPGKHGLFYAGIRMIRVPTIKNASFNAVIYSILATIKASFKKYDVLHFHAEGPCIMLWLPKLLGKRVVVTIHGLDWKRAKWGGFASRIIKYGEKMAAKHADEIIVLSQDVQDYFKEIYGRDTHFIPNGISRSTPRQAEEIKTKYGIDKDGYIMTLSRVVPEKGIHYLLEAFKDIDTDKKLVISGGSSNAKAYMDMIHEMAKEDKRVILTGFVKGTRLEELISNTYLYVLPSDVEGMSISLLEAMSYGNACLVSDIKENTDVVEDHAESFKHGNVEDLRDKLKYLIEHKEVVNSYREGASDYICTRFSWDKMKEETEKLYV